MLIARLIQDLTEEIAKLKDTPTKIEFNEVPTIKTVEI